MKSLKNFGISVGVSVVIFGIVALFMIKFLTGAMLGVFEDNSEELDDLLKPSTNATGETSAQTEVNSATVNIQGNSFALLLVGVNDISESCDEYFPEEGAMDAISKAEETFGSLEKYSRYKSAGSIVLIRADKERGEYTFTPVSPVTMVNTDSGMQRLGDVYITGGRDYFIDSIEAATGIRIDKYIAVKASDAEKLMADMGAVSCTVPCDIYSCGYDYLSEAQKNVIEDENKAIKDAVLKVKDEAEKKKLTESIRECNTALGKGSKTVSTNAAAVMMFADYSDGISDELSFTESFAKGVMANLSKMSEQGLTELLTKTGEYLDTDITSSFISENYGLISEYNNFEKVSVALPGTFVSAEDPFAACFNIDEDAAIDAFFNYRKLPVETSAS